MRTADRALGMIGMARRAGRIASGEFAVEKMIQSGRAACVILAEDASENTKKKFRDKCEFYEVPLAEFLTREALGHAIGTEDRVTAAVDDPGFADAIMKLYEQLRSENNGGIIRENI